MYSETNENSYYPQIGESFSAMQPSKTAAPYAYCMPVMANYSYVPYIIPFQMDCDKSQFSSEKTKIKNTSLSHKLTQLLDENIDIDTFIQESKQYRNNTVKRIKKLLTTTIKSISIKQKHEPILRSLSNPHIQKQKYVSADGISETIKPVLMDIINKPRPLKSVLSLEFEKQKTVDPPERIRSSAMNKKVNHSPTSDRSKDQLVFLRKKMMKYKHKIRPVTQQYGTNCESVSILVNGEKRKIDLKEMVATTKKKYKMLPEIIARRREKEQQLSRIKESNKKKQLIKEYELVYSLHRNKRRSCATSRFKLSV